MLRVADVLTTVDVLAIDRMTLTDFGADAESSLSDKRRIAVDDWLAGELQKRGFPPQKHLTRRAPDALKMKTGSAAIVDVSLPGRSGSSAYDLTVGLAASTDYMLIGSRAQFRSAWFTMLSSVNANTLSVASVSYWNGGKWAGLTSANSFVDRTTAVSSIAFSGGGSMEWQVPDDWSVRPAADDPSSDWLYWVRLNLNQRPSTGTLLYQLATVRRSRLTTPAAYYALHLLHSEAARGGRARYAESAERYAKKAYTSLDREVGMIADEFDVDASGVVSSLEANSVVPEDSMLTDPFTFERG